MVSEALPDEPAASTTTLVSPSVAGATNGIRAMPAPSVTAVPIEATPTESVTRTPARGPVVPTTYTVARTPWPAFALALSSVTVTVNPTICVTCCAVTVSFCVVSLPARSRETTAIGTDPGVAENESMNAPSGVITTMRPLTVMVGMTRVGGKRIGDRCGADANIATCRKVDRAPTLQKWDRRLDLGYKLSETGPDRTAREGQRDQRRDTKRQSKRCVEPPRAHRSTDARTPSDRAIAIARDRIPASRVYAHESDQRSTLPRLQSKARNHSERAPALRPPPSAGGWDEGLTA